MASSPSSPRPLSPHLQVYRFQITMSLSILHRITGVGLAVGTLLLLWWLIAVAAGPEAYGLVLGFVYSWIGRLLLFGWTVALFYHLCNGVRHMLWEARVTSVGCFSRLHPIYHSFWSPGFLCSMLASCCYFPLKC